jgi:hypothetical protein
MSKFLFTPLVDLGMIPQMERNSGLERTLFHKLNQAFEINFLLAGKIQSLYDHGPHTAIRFFATKSNTICFIVRAKRRMKIPHVNPNARF